MNNQTSPEPVFATLISTDYSKPFYLSRTFWVNILAMLCLVFPAVRAWAAENPEAPVIILSFVNLLLRTATDKAVSLTNDMGASKAEVGGISDDVKSPSGRGGSLPLGILLVCAISLLCLPSCGTDFTGTLSFRDANSGAKGGLSFDGEGSPHGFFRVPIYDGATGNLVGQADLTGDLAGEIEATK